MAEPNEDEERRLQGQAFLDAVKQMGERRAEREAEFRRLLSAALANKVETSEEDKR